MRRIAAIVLPRVRLEIARDADPSLAAGDGVVAVVVARPRRPGAGGGKERGKEGVKDERSLLGNTRLDEVSPEAFALGVRPGHTIAAARARAASLSVRVVHEDAVAGALARLAEALLAFGATTSMSVQDDAVWVDFTGCAHLYGGEERLADEIARRVRALGHACRVGVADGPRIAAQLAWFSRQHSPLGVTIAKPGAEAMAAAMRPLPVSALPIDGETLRWLRSSGLRTVGDVQSLPKSGAGVRLGPNAAEVLALLAGDDRAPLTPYVPPEVPEEKLDVEYGITSTDALVFVAKRLAARLATRLEGRGVGATRIQLVLRLDRALSGGVAVQILEIALPTPLALEAEILAVLRTRLESFVVHAPVLGASLRATELSPRRAAPLDLFVPEARADRALPRLVAELVADLGGDAVGQLALENRWSPVDRAALVPFGTRPAKPPRLASLEGRAEEPTRLLPRPKLLSMSLDSPLDVNITRRLEGIEWWRGEGERKDYGEAWIAAAGAMAWVCVDRDGVRVRGWVD